MDVNNTNSVQDEQFDNVKNNIEITVEVAETTIETVNENESEKSFDEVETETDDISIQASENESIDSLNEETPVAAEPEKLTDETETDKISVQISENEGIDSLNEETPVATEPEKLTGETETDEISVQASENESIDSSNEEVSVDAEPEKLTDETETDKISVQISENESIDSSSEEVSVDAEPEKLTGETEIDKISVQISENESIDSSSEETSVDAEPEKLTGETETDEISVQASENESIDYSSEETPVAGETEKLITETDEIIDFSSEEALIAAESEEFDLENDGEIDSEEDTEISSDFSNMNKTELIGAFRTILETQPVEKIRKDVDAVKTSFYKILRQEQDAYKQEYVSRGNDIESYVAPIDKDEIEFKSLFNSYKIKRSAYLRNLENSKEENYIIKLKLIDELKELVGRKENINRTFQEFKELQKKWRETGPIPQTYMKDLWDTYNHHIENFYDYLKINQQLRDMDFKRNLEAKIQLCEKAEELLLEPSVVNAFRKLQKYHEQWRETGPVANELKEQIWERFKEATAKINRKHQEYFEQQKDAHEQNLKAKIILCEKIEELIAGENKANKEWNKASKTLVEMQKAWKSIGFASKKDNAKIYLRFRKACDEFFTGKRKFYSEFKKSMDDNLRLKLELCERAEALSKNTDWKKTTDQFVKLQKEWREIGIVPRKVSAEVWKRFRSACDAFFNNRNSTQREQDSRFDENLKAKEAIINEIKGYKANENVVKNLDAIKDFQRRWAAIGYVPIKEKSRVQSEYRNALDNLFKVLNISDKDRKMVKFKTRLESAQANKGQIKTLRNERDKLLLQIRQIEADIALWENNIGFFAKSKNADTVVSEVRRKIEKGREEVIILEEKIKLLDQTI